MNINDIEVATLTGRYNNDLENGTLEQARFYRPYGMVKYDGKIFVSDMGNNAIRVIDDDIVSTLEILPLDRETIHSPTSLCVSSTGIIYMTEPNKSRVTGIDTNGNIVFRKVSTRNLNTCRGICIDPNDRYLYVACYERNCICRIDIEDTSIVCYAGFLDTNGYIDGPVGTSRFDQPVQIIYGVNPTTSHPALFISDGGNRRIRMIDLLEEVVTTLAGDGNRAHRDGSGQNCSLDSPWALLQDSLGDLYVVEHNVNTIRKILLTESIENPPVITISGNPTAPLLTRNGKGTEVTYKHPVGLFDNGDGDMLITEYAGHCIRVMKGVLPLAKGFDLSVEVPETTFMDQLYAMELSTETHDVTFKVHGEIITAHRFILQMRCEYFRTMFNSPFKESLEGEINFDQTTPGAVRAVVHYFYTDTLEIDPNDLLECLVLAQYLMLERLEKLCLEEIVSNLTPKYAVSALIWSYNNECSLPEVINYIGKYVLKTVFNEDDCQIIRSFKKNSQLLSNLLKERIDNDLFIVFGLKSKYSAIKVVISYLRKEDFEINADNLYSIFDLADHLDLTKLVNMCKKFMLDNLSFGIALEWLVWISSKNRVNQRTEKVTYLHQKLRNKIMTYIAKNYSTQSKKYAPLVKKFVKKNSELTEEILELQINL